MTSIEIADSTAAIVREQAGREGLSVDAYVRRLALLDSLGQHNAVLDQEYYATAEAERLAS